MKTSLFGLVALAALIPPSPPTATPFALQDLPPQDNGPSIAQLQQEVATLQRQLNAMSTLDPAWLATRCRLQEVSGKLRDARLAITMGVYGR